jgi:hypothetical protein
MTMTEETMDDGVKVVGATVPDEERSTAASGKPREKRRRRSDSDRSVPSRRAFRLASFLAVFGVIGTLVFGILYTTKSSGGSVQDPAVVSASRAFLSEFFNFNASIHKALERELAESRGQIR